jgi:hypothetical protein
MTFHHLRMALPPAALRGLLVLLALASIAHGATLASVAIPPTQTINGSPLQISVDAYSNVTVLRSEVDSVGAPATFDKQYYSVYSPFLVITPAVVGAPAQPAVWSGYVSVDSTSWDANAATSTLTPVSNTLSEDGMSIVTVATADSGNITIQQTVTYVNGAQQYQHTFLVTNSTTFATYNSVALRYGGDTYFADSDEATGFWDATLGFVYCTDPNVSGLMGMYGGASSPATNYYEDGYANVWTALETPGSPLPDTVNSTFIDNGMALEWEEGTLIPGGSFSVTVIEEWTAAGAVQVLPPPSQNISVGTPVTLSFTVQNLEAVDDTFTLSVTAASGLNPSVQSTVAVPANGTMPVTVTVSAIALGGTETVTLTATSQTTPSVTNQGVATLTALVAIGTVVVTPPQAPVAYSPGTTFQVSFPVQNLETFPASDTFTISAAASSGFLVGALAPATLSINGTAIVNAQVTALTSAPASGTLQLTATSQTTASIAGQATASLIAVGVDVLAPPVQHAGVGVTLTIPFTVINYQGAPATFTFTVTAPAGMTATTPASVIIPAAGSAVVDVTVTIASLSAGALNAVTLTAISGSFTSQAATQLVATAPVALPAIPLSSGPQTVYNSISPTTPEGVANLLAVMAPENANTAQAYAWDALAQAYAQLPGQPSGGLQPSSGVFLATRHSLGLDFSGTPSADPFYLTLQPGWNFIGIPLLIDGTGTLITSHAFPADFTLYDQNNVQIADALTFTNDLGTVGSGILASANPYYYDGSAYTQVATLSVSMGYWIKNNTVAPLTLVRNQTGTLTTLSRLGRSSTTRTAADAGSATGVLIDRGSPPPPPGASSAGDGGGGGRGCGLGTGAAFLAGLSLMLTARRLRRTPAAPAA